MIPRLPSQNSTSGTAISCSTTSIRVIILSFYSLHESHHCHQEMQNRKRSRHGERCQGQVPDLPSLCFRQRSAGQISRKTTESDSSSTNRPRSDRCAFRTSSSDRQFQMHTRRSGLLMTHTTIPVFGHHVV